MLIIKLIVPCHSACALLHDTLLKTNVVPKNFLCIVVRKYCQIVRNTLSKTRKLCLFDANYPFLGMRDGGVAA